jgi:hypothetical protein
LGAAGRENGSDGAGIVGQSFRRTELFDIGGAGTAEPGLDKTIKAGTSLEGDGLMNVAGAEEAGSSGYSMAGSLLGGDDLIDCAEADLLDVKTIPLDDVGGADCWIASDGMWPENFRANEAVVAEDVARGVAGGDG